MNFASVRLTRLGVSAMATDFDRSIQKITAGLTALEKKQIPFALSVALNNTANHAKREAQRQMRRRLDNPTPFTVNGIAVIRSNKRSLVAKVLIKDVQAEYMKFSVRGGRSGKRVSRPANIRLNKFGNIPGMRAGKKIRALLNRPDTFAGSLRGIDGVWQRVRGSRSLKLLIRFVDSQTYGKKYPFHEIVMTEARKQFEPEFRKSLNRAIATAFR